jgi:hypothetical protein
MGEGEMAVSTSSDGKRQWAAPRGCNAVIAVASARAWPRQHRQAGMDG